MAALMLKRYYHDKRNMQRLLPKGSNENYYVLWEVDHWTREPPRDPYLLRRITDNMFVVIAAWNLTDLERAVIKGRTW